MLYWYARSLERSGRRALALALMRQLAASINTNYYPALAESRTGVPLPVTPAALVEDPAPSVPQLQGVESFHLLRALALKQLGLQALEVGELRRLEPASDRIESLRSFLVHEFQAAGAWYDAIRAAIRMAARGEIDHWQAEHIRYPRAFWDLVKPAAERMRLDPYLVLAVIRQESLFNPEARSVSDARGLMQLIPATAVREAAAGFGPFDGPQSLYQPEFNIALGTAHLRHLLETFSGDRVRAIAAYNAGSAPVRHWDAQFAGEQDDEWVENIGYQETRDYVKRVLGNLREYRLLYGRTKAAGQAHAAEHPSSG
jgi:soluble lytic murein transglycosylase